MSRTHDALERIIGGSVRRYRGQRGLSLAALGEAVGVAGQQIQKYERAIDRVPASRLYRIALALGVQVTAFFDAGREIGKARQGRIRRGVVRERMLGFWNRRRERAALVKADAEAMIAQHGDRAYAQARLLTHQLFDGSTIDGNRPEGHWDRVQAEIGRLTGRRDRIDA